GQALLRQVRREGGLAFRSETRTGRDPLPLGRGLERRGRRTDRSNTAVTALARRRSPVPGRMGTGLRSCPPPWMVSGFGDGYWSRVSKSPVLAPWRNARISPGV